MDSIKDQLKNAVDEIADQQTKDCFASLTEGEATKLKADIERSFSLIKGVMPLITIKELRKNGNVITWKLLCKTEIMSSTKL